jgi:hypothetical protein
MMEISFKCARSSENRFSDSIQIEHPAVEEPNRECAEVLCAVASQEFLAIDFPNEVRATADILTKLKVEYLKGASCISVKINPSCEQETLRNICRLCGYTSQQFAIGPESQINAYLEEEDRISKFIGLATDLSCIGQLECYKDRIEFTTRLPPEEILQRLKKLPYQIRF